MGNKLFKQKEYGIMVEGLYDAGKTTILHQLKLGEVVTNIPTIGVAVESVNFKNYSFTTWDLGGRCSMRPLLRHYHTNCSALIFVVDSNDREQMKYAKYELQSSLADESLKDAVVLILANKQDLPGAANIQEVMQMLDLSNINQTHCNIFGTCATTGEGLYEALDWLSTTLANKDQPTSHEEVKQYVSTTEPVNSAKESKDYFRKIRASIKSAFMV